MVVIHTGQGDVKSYLTEIIWKKSKDRSVLRLDFLAYETNLKRSWKMKWKSMHKGCQMWRKDQAQA